MGTIRYDGKPSKRTIVIVDTPSGVFFCISIFIYIIAYYNTNGGIKMAKQLWLVVEENQYTIETMRDYFISSDVELYCISEKWIENALKKNKFNIVLVSFKYMTNPNLITYFKDYHLPVIVYDAIDDPKVNEFEKQHVDKILYGQIQYSQLLHIGHQLIKDYTLEEEQILYFKDMELHVASCKLFVAKQEVMINEREASFLELLIRHPYSTYPVDKVKELLYKENAAMTKDYIEKMIKQLINKLADANPKGKYIADLWQTGYKMIID